MIATAATLAFARLADLAFAAADAGGLTLTVGLAAALVMAITAVVTSNTETDETSGS